jgi:ubiquinone/menaquinone biosynthesis C-methylase UbiE
VKEYYDRRAPEYDDWYAGVYYTDDQRASFQAEILVLHHVIAGLAPARTLDVACGTGFLTEHLRGEVTGLDWSDSMLEIARRRVPGADFVQGDALALPFPDRSFGRLFTGHFYGHLEPEDRTAFLREARRVADRLVVVDAALRPDHAPEEWQERVLSDGSRWPVFKRFFEPGALAEELGGGQALFAGRWFVVVES